MLRRLLLLCFVLASSQAHAETLQFSLPPDTIENRFHRETFNGGSHEIFASGEIDENAAQRLAQFVSNNKIDHATVVLNSPGGSLGGGINLGRAIRELNFNTRVGSMTRRANAICASSCAYAFAGGVYRYFSSDSARLGIHQFYQAGDNRVDAGDAQQISSVIVDHLQTMGVDPQAFVVASAVAGDSMVWLSVSDAVALGLANNGSDPTTVEIRMSGAAPYLRLEQSHATVTARALLGCDAGKIGLMAGIVTTPELSQERWEGLQRNYLEDADGRELLPSSGQVGAKAVGSVLWLDRSLDQASLGRLLSASQLGIWTENGGPMRWGATLDLRPAKEKLRYFVSNCLRSTR